MFSSRLPVRRSARSTACCSGSGATASMGSQPSATGAVFGCARAGFGNWRCPMSDPQRVIDDIGALVDAALAEGEAGDGYALDVSTLPRCRCGCRWHGLALSGCPGTDFEGPLMATGLRMNWPEDMPESFGYEYAEMRYRLDRILSWPVCRLIGSVRAQINRSWRWLG